jgi:hypothetical protein
MKVSICIIAALAFFALLASCGNGGHSASDKKDSSTHHTNAYTIGSGGEVFISTDSANKMISSYLNSIDYQHNDSSLRSLIFDADSLRAYLSNVNIKHVKVMFAHTLDYINTNGQGNNAGYRSGALTVVFGGFDDQDNYVFWQTNRILDHGQPCPMDCVNDGTAASDLFPQ